MRTGSDTPGGNGERKSPKAPPKRSIHVSLSALAAAALTLLAAAPPAEGRETIDVVHLVNGDQATAEIVQLENGMLTLRTVSFGTVDIEWTDVVGLTSVQLFDVTRSDGVRFFGRLDRGEKPNTLLIHLDGRGLLEMPLKDVFYIRQLGASIWQGRRGRLNLGLDYTNTNQDLNFSLDTQLDFQGRRFRFKNTLTSSITDDASREARQRSRFESDFEIPAGKEFVVLTRGSWDRNDELDLESRVNLGATLVWLPWRSPHGRFGLGAGLMQSEEKYEDEASSHAVTGAVALVTWEYYRFGPYGTRASVELGYVPILSESDRYRFEARGSFTQKIARNFNITISPYYSFDSHPPRATLNDEDWGLLSSAGWNF